MALTGFIRFGLQLVALWPTRFNIKVGYGYVVRKYKLLIAIILYKLNKIFCTFEISMNSKLFDESPHTVLCALI